MFAQNEVKRANHWYYATNIALDFTCAPPTDVPGCQLGSSECATTMSTANGDLLFYSDGVRVWDRNNNLMPNGSGLAGSTSTVQGALAVPHPGNPNRYFLFTAGSSIEDMGLVGLNYSEIDMTLNAGNGDVVVATKNTFLFSPNEEKLTAVRNASNTGYWVTAQEKSGNSWYTYEVTAAGVNPTPVISVTGPNARVDNSLMAKFSPDGNWLATQNGCQGGSNAAVTVYKFNNATGVIDYAWSDCGTPGFKMEFSPNSTKLYAGATRIYQYDLSAGGGTGVGNDTTAVKASRTEVSTATRQGNVGMQLGPDCKLYIATREFGFGGSSYIGAFNNPNEAGAACNIQPNIFTPTNGSISSIGHFPNFVTSFFENPCNDSIEVELTPNDTVICAGESITLEAFVDNPCAYTITWNTGDVGLGPHMKTPAATTTYQIIVSNATNSDTADVTVVVGGGNAGNDTAFQVCASTVDLDANKTANSDIGGGWFDASYVPTTSNVTLTTGLNTFYYILGSGPCGDTAVYDVTRVSGGSATLFGNDTTICGNSYVLDLSQPNTTYEWSDGSTADTLLISTSGLYWAETTNTVSGCIIRDSITITLNTPGNAGRDTAVFKCEETIDLFDALEAGYTTGGTWFDAGFVAQTMPLTTATAVAGDYYYIVGSGACSDTATIGLSLSNLTLDLGNDTTICDPTLVLRATTANVTYLWNDGSMEDTLLVNTSGLYWAEITDITSSCSFRDSITITLVSTVDAGRDTAVVKCEETIDLFDALEAGYTTGGTWFDAGFVSQAMPLTTATAVTGNYYYIVGSGSCTDTATVGLSISVLTADIGNDTAICDNQYVLDAFTTDVTYLWNDASTTDTLLVTTSGVYSVTITDTNTGCQASDTTTITLASSVNAGSDSTAYFCYDSLDLTPYLGAHSVGGNWFNASFTGVTMPLSTADGAGNYYYIVGSGTCADTAQINVINYTYNLNLGPDTSLCANISYTIQLQTAGVSSFLWDDGDVTSSNQIASPDTLYWVDVEDSLTGCVFRDSLIIQFIEVAAGRDTFATVCENTTVDLNTYLVDNNSTGTWLGPSNAGITMPFNFQLADSGIYKHVVSNGNCTDTAFITVQVVAAFAGADTSWTTCNDSIYDLNTTLVADAPTGGIWLDDQFNPSSNNVITQNGLNRFYYVINVGSCTDTSTYDITSVYSGSNSFLGNDTSLCETETIQLSAPANPNFTYLWSTGNTTNTETATFPDSIYWLDITDTASGCTFTDSVLISFNQVLDAGLDTTVVFCNDTLVDLSAYLRNNQSTNGTWLDDNDLPVTMPQNINASNAGVFKFILTDGACSDTAFITISHSNTVNFSLGNDTALCENESLTLAVNLPGYDILWNSGSMQNTEVVNQPGGQVSVTLTNQQSGCVISDSIQVTFDVIPDLGNDSLLFVCSSEQVNLFDALPQGVDQSGTWTNSGDAVLLMPIDPFEDTYKYTLQNGACLDSVNVTIQLINTSSDFSYFPEEDIFTNDIVSFQALSGTNDTYQWLIDGVPVSNDIQFENGFDNPGEYIICLAVDLSNCVDTTCTEITVGERLNVFVPSSFSPNNDGINDEFTPIIQGDYESYEFTIYNQWGQEIFTTNKKDQVWRGMFKYELVPVGVYVWKINYKETGGVTNKSIHGHVTVVR